MKIILIKKQKTLQILWTIITLLWCLFIFSKSLQSASVSSVESRTVLEVIQKYLQMFIKDVVISHNFIRKSAHFFLFFVLGTLLSLSAPLWKKDIKYHFLRTNFAGLFVALVDETIQLSSPGRSGQITDVWLDFSAIVFSHLLFTIIYLLIKHKKQKSL